MESLNNHIVIVIALEHYNPLGQLRALGENGIRPVFIAINHKVRVASVSKWPSKVHLVETEEEAFDVLMREYGDVAEKTGYIPIVSFSDDKTVTFYDQRYDELKDKFIIFNAGKTGRITQFMRKKEIVDCARRHGVPVAPDWLVENGEVPANIEYPVITKAFSPVEGCYKGDFHICQNEEELKKAFAAIESEQVFIQKYIDKKTEMTYEGFSYNHGKGMYVGVQTHYQYAVKGYYSPLQYCQPRVDAELQTKLNAMLEEIGFEGIWEIEFLVDKDDKIYFLEINFRRTSGSFDHDDVIFFCQFVKSFFYFRDQLLLICKIISGTHVAKNLTVYDDLGTNMCGRLEQNRIHGHHRFYARCFCLHHLCTPHL